MNFLCTEYLHVNKIQHWYHRYQLRSKAFAYINPQMTLNQVLFQFCAADEVSEKQYRSPAEGHTQEKRQC